MLRERDPVLGYSRIRPPEYSARTVEGARRTCSPVGRCFGAQHKPPSIFGHMWSGMLLGMKLLGVRPRARLLGNHFFWSGDPEETTFLG